MCRVRVGQSVIILGIIVCRRSRYNDGRRVNTVHSAAIRVQAPRFVHLRPALLDLSLCLCVYLRCRGSVFSSLHAVRCSVCAVAKQEKRRRSSWQTKLDRRRRKGMMTSAATIDDDTPVDLDGSNSSSRGGGSSNDIVGIRTAQQKRNSWWNIFVPDNLKQR